MDDIAVIDKDRIMHMHSVAEYMYNHAKDYGLDDIKTQLYAVGLMHDIGAAISKTDHEIHSSELLESIGMDAKYIDIIKFHGSSPEDYCSEHNVEESEIPSELLLLWEADLHTGPSGQYMSYDERLDEMVDRHKRILREEYADYDPHVMLTVEANNSITDVGYHETYGNVAKSVIRLLQKQGRM